MSDLKANFLVLVRQDKALLKKLGMTENLYGRDSQTQFVRGVDSDLVLTFESDKIEIVRYQDSFAVEIVEVDNISDAYKQVRYYGNHGKLRNGEPV
jgi:hypothetical protein